MKIKVALLALLATGLSSFPAFSLDLTGNGGSQIACEDALQEVLKLTHEEYDAVQVQLMNRDGITGSILDACISPECGGARHGLDNVDACRNKILSNSEMKIDELRSFLQVPRAKRNRSLFTIGKPLKESLFKEDSDISNCKRIVVGALGIDDAEVLNSNFDKIIGTIYKDEAQTTNKDKNAIVAAMSMAYSCGSPTCRNVIAGLGGAKECKDLIKRHLDNGGWKLSTHQLESMLTAKYDDCKEKVRSVLGIKDLEISEYFFEEKPSDENSTEAGPGKKTVDACKSSACESIGDSGKLKNPKACKEKLVATRGGEREFKIRLNVPVDCTTSYYFDDSGAVTVKTDSPDISKQFQETKTVDDDGYIALVTLLNVMRDSKADSSGHVIVSKQDTALMKKALQRSIDYAKTYESQVDDQYILDTFKSQVSFAETMLKYIDERTDGKFSKEKIGELGAFLEKDKDFHGYYINDPQGELYGVCQEYGAVPRCCTANDPEKNNLFATSLCNRNLASGEPNLAVFRYEKTMCASNKIQLNPPSKSHGGVDKDGKSITTPKN